MTLPQVSVAIPTYNHEKFIATILESVISQTTTFPFEVLVGDDASSDNTQNIIQSYVEKYQEIIKPIIRDENIGAQRNINNLYLNAKGKYIAVLDGDDYMYPGKLQKQYDFLESNPSCGSVFHNMDIIKNGIFIRKFCDETLRKDYYTVEDFVEKGTFLPHTSKMFLYNVLIIGA